jgi:hypothetical protein
MLRRAAAWLDASIGTDGGETEKELDQVVEWLFAIADQNELRAMCREAGIPVADARRRLKA